MAKHSVVERDRGLHLEMTEGIAGIRADQLGTEVDAHSLEHASQSGCAAPVHAQNENAGSIHDNLRGL